MVRDAEKFAEEDKKRRAAAEAKNNAESLIHTTERQLADNGDKIDDALKSEIQTAIDAAKQAVESGDADQMTEKSQALAQVAMKMGQAIYEKQAQADASPSGGAAQGGEPAAARKCSTPSSPKSTKRSNQLPSPFQGRGWPSEARSGEGQ
jgi:molecular chaperone DnaK